jgi:hypothetical protein
MEQARVISSDSKIVFSQQGSKYRLVEDAFITPEECKPLIELVGKYGTVGDGYGGNPHPHIASEIFGGYSFDGVHNKTQKALPGHLEALAVMKKVQKKLKSHFGLPALWLDFVHLVFREPNAESLIKEHGVFMVEGYHFRLFRW